MATVALTIGDRVKLTEKAGPMIRPLGTRTGQVIDDCDDCWKVVFDGTKTARRIFKPYLEREAA